MSERELRERLVGLYSETLHELNAATGDGEAAGVCYKAMRSVLALAERSPCLIPDFDGDRCDPWVEKYGQEPCATCAPWQS